MSFVFPLVIGKKKWLEKPNNTQVPSCQNIGHYVKKEVSIAQAFTYITEGRCWRAGILKDNAQNLKKESFEGAQIFALDFDSCEKTPQEIIEYCQSITIPANFWYWSFSQGGKKPNNNFRIVWVFSHAISAAQYEDLYNTILQDNMFIAADKATKDISRLWFGTSKGGELLREEPIDYNQFSLFTKVETVSISDTKKRTRAYYQGKTAQDFIMETEDFIWDEALQGVCDLWDKWVNREYLHYNQRLLLFTELKCLKYAEGISKTILDRIMSYYDEKLYAGSKCNIFEVSYFMSNKTKNDISNPIVRMDNEEYTISEYFHSGAYKRKLDANEGVRITRDELQKQADDIIPKTLAAEGIHYIECQTEAGKTERIINYLCGIDFNKSKIIYSVPTYKLINEFISRLEKAGFDKSFIHYPKKIDYTEEELILMDASFPEHIKLTQEMLERKQELQKINDKSVRGLFLITHTCLAHLRAYDVYEIIIDENIEDLAIDRSLIPLSKLYALNAYLNKEGKEELKKLTEIIDDGEPQQVINNIDVNKLFRGIDINRLVHSKNDFRDENNRMYPIGKIKYADKLSIGEDRFHNKYLYIETMTKLFKYSIDNGVRVKLFTGTPKIAQLSTGLPKDIAEEINKNIIKIHRAKPLGHIYQFKKFRGSKYNLEKPQVWKDIQNELEKHGVDWRNTNTLTLKAYCDVAREKYHFKIPKSLEGEYMYIENCAGLDCIKGEDLIVIGKADKPRESYIDMTGGKIKDVSASTKARVFEDIPGAHKIFGFNDNRLWELQAEQMRLYTLQAVARARTLWHDVKVYVFCDFPVIDAQDID